MSLKFGRGGETMPLRIAVLPVAALLLFVLLTLIFAGSDCVAEYSYLMLLGASVVALTIGIFAAGASRRDIIEGIHRSSVQTLPAIPILLLIGTVSATWMLSGVVPILIDTGMHLINPRLFLIITCSVCAFISILTGSSWTTIATIGVAFMGIGTMLGYSAGWIAGAIISGAYFGDKISPLSDTTVLSASSTGVELFRHIRYMLLTTVPSLLITFAVFLIAGYLTPLRPADLSNAMTSSLASTFNLSPWILLIPAVTLALIFCRLNTMLTLGISTLLGLVGIFIFQPQMFAMVLDGEWSAAMTPIAGSLKILFNETSISTGNQMLDSLASTGGMRGMLPTVWLVLSAMLFGGIMVGAGLLKVITKGFTSLLHNRVSAVSATAASGLFLNCATADQYLSIIIGANMYTTLYRRLGLEDRLLSRTLEDSTSVTSVLVPWNSCGVTQSSVLGVPTLSYIPYCVFNYVSPLMSILIAVSGFKIVEDLRARVLSRTSC